MNASTVIGTSTAVHETDVSQAVRSLGAALRASPELVAFLAASQAISADAVAQELLQQIHAHQVELQWGQEDRSQHAAALRELQAELEALPSIQAYYQAGQTARELLVAVDAAIGEAAGVEFAANSKRSCCGS
jgi:cell fate (sporulation/competence/biofilm development) regulator YlbF (YheA/YmcA/DUF963 family)